MPGRPAGSPIAVYARVQCREPKTGQEKVQLLYIAKTIHFSYLPIIYLWYIPTPTVYLATTSPLSHHISTHSHVPVATSQLSHPVHKATTPLQTHPTHLCLPKHIQLATSSSLSRHISISQPHFQLAATSSLSHPLTATTLQYSSARD